MATGIGLFSILGQNVCSIAVVHIVHKDELHVIGGGLHQP